MPTVPTRPLQSVTPNPISGQKLSSSGATPDAFGASIGRATQQFGQAIGQAGDTLADIVLKEQLEANERDAKTRDVEYAKRIENILYGDPDTGTQGYYSLQGQAALDAAPSLTKQFEDAKRLALQGANPAVQRILESQFAQREESSRKGVGRFLLQERDKANKAVSDARKAQAVSDAVKAINDPQVFADAKRTVDSEAYAEIKRRGLTGEAAKRVVVEGRTVLVKETFDAALNSEDYQRAIDIFKENFKDIDGVVASDMLKRLNTASITAQAQALVASAQQQFPNDEKAQLEYLKKVDNGKLKDKAFEVIREQFAFADRFDQQKRQVASDRRRAVEQAHADVKYAAWIADTKRKAETRKARQDARDHVENGGSINTIPRETWNMLENEDQNHLRKRQEQIMSGVPIITSVEGWDTYQKLVNMPPEKLKDVNLLSVRNTLADREYKIVEDYVNQARRGQFDNQNLVTPQQLFNAKAAQLGIDKKDKQEKYGQLHMMFLSEIALRAQEKGKDRLTNKEMIEVLDDLTDPIILKETRGGLTGFFGGAERGDISTIRAFDVEIPEKDRKQIIKTLQARGIKIPLPVQIRREFIRQNFIRKAD